ncbi:MAG: diacylglycerol kinase family protein [Actinomycetes bacterium]
MSDSPSRVVEPTPPSMRRRILAIVSLVATAILLVLVAVFLLKNPLWFIGGVIGLVLVVGGGWLLVTEQYPRRALGIVGVVVGALAVVGAVFGAYSDSVAGLWRALVLLICMVLAVGCARLALVRDLHDIDRLRSNRVRPQHPVLICNLKSGGGKVEKFGLMDMARDAGVEVVLLEPGLDLAQLARDAIARGADALGMAGGDGSQALVASIAIENNVPFVFISAGTRNHFALDLGLNREDPRTGMVALRDGVERRVDYAMVGDRLFVNNVSLGVYATIVQEDSYRDAKVETTKEKIPEMLGRQAEPFDLQFTNPDGREVDGAFLIMVSNNPYVMGPSLDISQRRSMDSGQLGVFAVTASSGAEAGKMVARSALGLGQRDPNMHQFEATEFEVRSRSGRALAGVDGETLDLPTPLKFRIHPGGMRILVPEQSVMVAEKRRARGISVGDLLAIASGKAPKRTRATAE